MSFPIQGSILIAEPFYKMPISNVPSYYINRAYPEHGSMGFVLNKKTDLIVNSFFKEFAEFPEMPIYLGRSAPTVCSFSFIP